MTSPNYERWAELADRSAVDETLSASEQVFLREYAETDPVASAEAALWHAMGDLDSAGNDSLDLALAARAVEAVQAARHPAFRKRRALWVAGGMFAAAAAVAALVSSRSARTDVASTSGSLVEYLGGEARADGVHLEKGARVAAGRVVEAMGGPVCVAVEPRIHACLASGAKLRLSVVGVAERHVDLLSGRVAVALDPLPKGERFSVVASGVWSTAVGTAFTVELEPSGAVQTIVHEGKVAVGPSAGGDVVSAHKIGLSQGDDVTVTTLADHAKTETPEWIALASVANRSIEAPTPPPVVEAPPAETPPVAPPVAESPTSPAARVPSPVAATAQAALPSAEDLLGTARQALRDQRWSDAAAAYRKLIGAYPSSSVARTVVVPLAKLEIDRLGQPAAALPSLDAYVASGGSLVVEARSARIRAYRALGRTADELRAIDEFLAAHPNSLDAEKLGERRDALRGK